MRMAVVSGGQWGTETIDAVQVKVRGPSDVVDMGLKRYQGWQPDSWRETEQLSMVSVRLWVLDCVDLVPTRRTSVLSQFCLREFAENQDLISVRRSEREEGGWYFKVNDEETQWLYRFGRFYSSPSLYFKIIIFSLFYLEHNIVCTLAKNGDCF